MKRRTRPRIRRTLLMVLLLLTGGAFINVVVAWGCAVLINVEDPKRSVMRFDGSIELRPHHNWTVQTERRPGALRVTSKRTSPTSDGPLYGSPAQLLPGWNDAYILWNSGDRRSWIEELDAEHFRRIQDGRGWPMLSLWSQAHRSWEIPGTGYAVQYGIVLTLPRWTPQFVGSISSIQGARILPLHPIWPNFAIDTIFYAVILWLPFAPGFVRRRWRIKYGKCPACAYPVGASDVCTECGKPVKQPKLSAVIK